MNRPHLAKEIRERVRSRAQNRCGYCLTRQEYSWGKLEIEHIIPMARGGSDSDDNLWLACRPCNLHKKAQIESEDPVTGKRVSLFNPYTQIWAEHFQWSLDGSEIIGLTANGRATVLALQLNDVRHVALRKRWIEVGWHPPKD